MDFDLARIPWPVRQEETNVDVRSLNDIHKQARHNANPCRREEQTALMG